MKQRELLEEQIKEKKERELKNFINKKNNIIRQNKSYAPLIGENQYNNDLNNIKSNNNNINDEYIKEQNFEQVKNQYNMMNERPEPQNEISYEMFKLKEEQIKSHEKIKIVDDLDDANTNNNIDGEKTPLDRSMKLYNNNIQIKKPKFYGKIKSFLYLFNKPIFMSAESSKL